MKCSSRAGSVLAAFLVVCIGCGKGTAGRAVKIPEMGLSLTLPAGWQTEPRYRSEFYDPAKRDDSRGGVIEYALEGMTLAEFVEDAFAQLERMEATQKALLNVLEKAAPAGLGAGAAEAADLPQTRIISSTPCTISGMEAIEVVYEANYTIMEVFIRRGDKAVGVTFRCLKEDFPSYEPAFREAIDSIRIH